MGTGHRTEIIRWAEERGWVCTRTKKGHLRFEKKGLPVLFTSGTPSDFRAYKNFQAQLLRTERQYEVSS